MIYVFKCCERTDFALKDGKENGAKVCPEHLGELLWLKKVCSCGEVFVCSKMATKRDKCNRCRNKRANDKRASLRKFESMNPLDKDKDMYCFTLEEISMLIGVSGERVRIIQNVALRKFRENFLKIYKEPPF